MSTGDGGGSVHRHVCRAARVFMQCGGVVSEPITWPGQGDALLISRNEMSLHKPPAAATRTTRRQARHSFLSFCERTPTCGRPFRLLPDTQCCSKSRLYEPHRSVPR